MVSKVSMRNGINPLEPMVLDAPPALTLCPAQYGYRSKKIYFFFIWTLIFVAET
jgi:hypothetical protein